MNTKPKLTPINFGDSFLMHYSCLAAFYEEVNYRDTQRHFCGITERSIHSGLKRSSQNDTKIFFGGEGKKEKEKFL